MSRTPQPLSARIRREILCALCVLGALQGAPTIQGASIVTFTDVTAAAGIKFVHTNGAFGKKYLPETLGSGCAFLDVDGDGWQDLLLIDSTNWPGQRRLQGPRSSLKLYRNAGNGRFTDATAGSGLDV